MTPDAQVIQLKPKRPRKGGGAANVQWQCPSCPVGFVLSYGYTALQSRIDQAGDSPTWRVELTCPYCGEWMEIPRINAEGGRAR